MQELGPGLRDIRRYVMLTGYVSTEDDTSYDFSI